MPRQIANGNMGLIKQISATLVATSLLLISYANAIDAPGAGYKLSANERRLIQFVIKDDMENFVQRNNAMFTWSTAERISIGDIDKAYGANQVAGDQKFYGKLLWVTGTIRSINSGIGNTPYLVAASQNNFLGPQLHFASGEDIARIAKLTKGEKISLFCVGSGSMAGTPMLKDCKFPDSYLDGERRAFEQDFNNFLAGKATLSSTRMFTKLAHQKNEPLKDPDELAFTIVLAPIVWARMLPPMSACFTDVEGSSCHTAINKLKNTGDQSDKAFLGALNDLKAAGVQFPARFTTALDKAKSP